MWIRKYSCIYQGVKKEAIWRLWADINNWPEWHTDLEYCKLEGDFTVGNSFILKPRKAPVVQIAITELIEHQRFVDCTRFFGAKMYDVHELEETEQGLRITNTLQVRGLLTWLWVMLVARNVAKAVPSEISTLVDLARSENA